MRAFKPREPEKATDRVTALLAFVDANSGATFDDIRAGVEALRKAPDGTLHQLLLDNGYPVQVE